MKLNILPGTHFGRLTILKEAAQRGKIRYFICTCDCGVTKEIALKSLTHGLTKSCGCLQKEHAKQVNYKNGLYKTRLHSIWQNMKQRCYNPNYKRYKDYGARGITICSEWLYDFKNFYNWAINNGYSDSLTIDRIKNDGNYEPNNCKWSNNFEQCRNTRSNRLIEYSGETKTLTEWCQIYNLQYKTLQNRLNSGWSIEDAFTLPLQTERRGKKHETKSTG